LHLVLPNLGEIDARIRLDGNNITLKIGANSSDTRTLIQSAAMSLRSQLGEAGLTLASMGVEAMPESTTNGQSGK
jgi:flagellar hook-length control protein FliK